jgi:hypothetical protein
MTNKKQLSSRFDTNNKTLNIMIKIITFFLILFLGLTTFGQWNQLGLDIDGEAADDRFGSAVSISGDGTTIVSGARNNDDAGSNAGQVRVYKLTSGTWSQLGADIDGDATDDWFGWSVDISNDGNIIAVGAGRNDGFASNAGQVKIYKFIAGNWTQQGGDIYGEAGGDQFGYKTSLSNDGFTVAISGVTNDDAGSDAGHVRVYKFTNGNWIQQGMDINGETTGDFSGTSLSISGDGSTVSIGAWKNSDAGTNAGHVRVYKFTAGNWTQVGTDIDGIATNDWSGWSTNLNINGTILAVSSINNDGAGTDIGLVRVYDLISGIWTQKGGDIYGEDELNGFGYSTCMSSDGLTIGISSTNNNTTGHVRVYKFISGAWSQHGIDLDGEAPYDNSGYAIAMSDDGSTIAIGAEKNDGSAIDAGHVRVYHFCSGTTTGTDVQSSCGNFTWIDGNTYTSSTNTPIHTIVGGTKYGCDSIVTLNLTIETAPNNTVTTSSTTITANETGASYQWIDCSNGNIIINGQTNSSYTATSNGDYAVIITINSCTDTSTCETISSVSINENDLSHQFKIYPNPINDQLTIESEITDLKITLADITGKNQQIETILKNKSTNVISLRDLPSGIYFMTLYSNNETITKKIIKQ